MHKGAVDHPFGIPFRPPVVGIPGDLDSTFPMNSILEMPADRRPLFDDGFSGPLPTSFISFTCWYTRNMMYCSLDVTAVGLPAKEIHLRLIKEGGTPV